MHRLFHSGEKHTTVFSSQQQLQGRVVPSSFKVRPLCGWGYFFFPTLPCLLPWPMRSCFQPFCVSVCLSVWFSVCRMSQKVEHRFSANLLSWFCVTPPTMILKALWRGHDDCRLTSLALPSSCFLEFSNGGLEGGVTWLSSDQLIGSHPGPVLSWCLGGGVPVMDCFYQICLTDCLALLLTHHHVNITHIPVQCWLFTASRSALQCFFSLRCLPLPCIPSDLFRVYSSFDQRHTGPLRHGHSHPPSTPPRISCQH